MLEGQLSQSRAQYIQLEARIREQEDMILEYQTRDEYTELQPSRNKIETLEKEEKDKINEKIMNLAYDVAEHVTALAREARILRPHFDSRFTKISYPYFTRLKVRIMNMEDKMTTMETNHQIAQAQQNTVGQIALMLGLPDPRRGKGVEESIPQSRMGISRTMVQFNVGFATSIPINYRITHNHDPELEIPNFDEVDDKSKVEKKLEDRCKKLEELIWSMQSSTTLGGIDARELSLVADLVVPPKFKAPNFEKFSGTICPSAHLTMYCTKMSLHLDNEKLLVHCFQDNMVGSYAQRWRDVAAQVQPPLLENEITLLFVNTIKDAFFDQMLDHATKPFADMVMKGELIQAAIKSGRIRGGIDSRKYSKKRDNEVNTTSSYVPGHSSGIIIGYTLGSSHAGKCDYQAGNPGHHINDCTALNYVVEQLLKVGMLSFEAPEKNPMPNQKGVNVVTKREFERKPATWRA
ncbi:hypothetical protein GQ457_05G023290 [Hibiscus cannabinus]